MSEIVGACLSQFHDDENSFELLLAYSDGREVGFSVSRNVAQKMASELANGAGCDPSAIERKEEPLEHVEKVSTEAAMSQWERSLKRPDLCEKDRVRGAIEAYKRQAFAFAISPTPPAAPVREGIEVTAEAHRVAMANTDDADVRTVLLAVLGCAQSWVGEARIIGNVRAADIVRALSSALSASPSPVDSRDELIADEAWVELCKLTFAVQHNPNCRSPWLVRLPGKGPIDMKPYADGLGFVPHQTGDILGFGKTLIEAARRALAAKEQQP